jgi:hypothetical protein
MSTGLQNIQKSWRFVAMLLLLALSFFKGWEWIFWVGFPILVLTDPGTYQRPQQPSGPLSKVLLAAYFLVMGCAVGIMIWEILTFRSVNTFWAITLILSGSLTMLLFGVIALRRKTTPEENATKRQEILKDL